MPGKIITMSLDDELLERINWVYRQLKEVLCVEMKNMHTEEQFQLLFMRDDQPKESISVWEDILRAWKVAQKIYGETDEIKQSIFRTLMFNLVDALSPEEREREDIKKIISIYAGLSNMDEAVKQSCDFEEEDSEG